MRISDWSSDVGSSDFEAVEDWDKMHERVTSIIEDLDSNPPPLPKAEIEQGQALLRWLADDHFTFLGYREYRIEEIDGEETLRGLPGPGFGILRAGQASSDEGGGGEEGGRNGEPSG